MVPSFKILDLPPEQHILMCKALKTVYPTVSHSLGHKRHNCVKTICYISQGSAALRDKVCEVQSCRITSVTWLWPCVDIIPAFPTYRIKL